MPIALWMAASYKLSVNQRLDTKANHAPIKVRSREFLSYDGCTWSTVRGKNVLGRHPHHHITMCILGSVPIESMLCHGHQQALHLHLSSNFLHRLIRC